MYVKLLNHSAMKEKLRLTRLAEMLGAMRCAKISSDYTLLDEPCPIFSQQGRNSSYGRKIAP
jgi:hypothetical protein